MSRKASTAMRPQKHGGALQTGNRGNRGGYGRPPNEIRELMRDSLEAVLPLVRAKFDAGEIDALKYADFLAKYSLGSTITATGSDGKDAKTPLTYALVAPNDSSSSDE